MSNPIGAREHVVTQEDVDHMDQFDDDDLGKVYYIVQGCIMFTGEVQHVPTT